MEAFETEKGTLLNRTGTSLRRLWAAMIFGIVLFTGLRAADVKCFTRDFMWSSGGKNFHLSIDLPWDGYDFYSKVPRVFTQYGVYAYEHPDYSIMPEVVKQFQALAKRKRLSEWGTIEMVVAFVQQLRYQSEPGEYPKFPMETLADKGGDCEDLSVLLSAILREMGYATRLINPPGHMALGLACKNCDGMYFVADGRKYFYVETTAAGFPIGTAPERYVGTKGRLFRSDVEDLAKDYLSRSKRRVVKRVPPIYYVREDERRRAVQWDGQVWIASAKLETMNVKGSEKKRAYLGGIGASEHSILPPLAWAARTFPAPQQPGRTIYTLLRP